ncbi:23S rRNA (guanine(745)-N(1))-methyltransferase [Vibrio sp. SM6]|uniref:23S rRNA (Guanine(745)-N(1))-methyltransferase n=1 Tax=Vibrio agarilyticus TaxID=2726741 RepID=A0A7X8YHW4_9VIBR|nr:23S rRNA (guanine(745)-N(1))-methyltransferase [Vibrio agarilyticus]NLS14528.1 23S rRNA (guanine(745)-N(1))-methyltransferase [Vibrio agarilyticus]
MAASSAYHCPLCHLPLALEQRTYRCANNHQFDVAKEGYVNLMPVQHKRSKDPGDNKEMMQARRRFLASDHYNPLRQHVASLCVEHLQNTSGQLLDIGCGEGYYTTEFANHLRQANEQAHVFGLDISKIAIRYAAKRYPNCDFVVASSHRLPFADRSLDGIVRIYAPCKAEELARTVRSGGVVITVTPAERHLLQLRELIYQDVRMHSEAAEDLTGFELIDEQKLNYEMALSGHLALDLLQMTPYAWKANDALRATLAAYDTFACEVDFMIRVYQRAIVDDSEAVQ